MPVTITLAWVDAYALQTLRSLSKVDRYLTRARELLAAGKLQQCTWQDDGGLQAVAAGSASDVYIVALLPAVPGPFTTSCSCPSHDKDGVCKHALAALLWVVSNPPLADLQQQQQRQPAMMLVDNIAGQQQQQQQQPDSAPKQLEAAVVTPLLSPQTALTPAAEEVLPSGTAAAAAAIPATPVTQTTPSQAGKRKRVLPGSLRPAAAPATQAAAADGPGSASAAAASPAKRRVTAGKQHRTAAGDGTQASDGQNQEQQQQQQADEEMQQLAVKRAARATGLAKRRPRIAPPSPGAVQAAAPTQAARAPPRPSAAPAAVATAAPAAAAPLAVRRLPWMLSPEQMLAVSDDQLLQQAHHCLDIVGRRLAAPSNTAAAADGHAAADTAAVGVASLPGKKTAVSEAVSAAADTLLPVAGAELVVPESVSLDDDDTAEPQLQRQPSMKAQQRQQQQVQTTPPSARRPRPSVVSRLLDGDGDDVDPAGTAGFNAAASLAGQGPQHAAAAQQQQQQGSGGAGAAGAAADAPGAMRQPAASGGSRGSTPGRKEVSGRSHLAALASRFLD